jgi:glycosyltransferase involved in cell wall biosynthesis
MKILFVSPENIEKASTFIKQQAAWLSPQGILSGGYRPFRYNGKSIFSFPLRLGIVRMLLKNVAATLYTHLYNKALYRFLKTENFDAILCQFGTQGAHIADACHKAGIPFAVHFHGYDAFAHKTITEYTAAYRNMFDKAACIIAVSEDMRKQLIKLGAPVEKVVLRPCGVDTTMFTNAQPSASEKIFLFVGRFTAKKDPVSLLKAFHYARQTVPDARLVMIGKGELHQLVVKTIEALHLQDSVEISGWQKPEEIVRRMQQARVYVQHSVFALNGDSEGSPVAIIEAAGSGLPVVSTRHAGIKESVIEGVTGFLVDEGDWQGMGEYMVKLLNDAELAGKMGEAGRRHILEHYDVRQQMGEIQEILEKVRK